MPAFIGFSSSCGQSSGHKPKNGEELKGLQLALEEQRLSLDALHQRREAATSLSGVPCVLTEWDRFGANE